MTAAPPPQAHGWRQTRDRARAFLRDSSNLAATAKGWRRMLARTVQTTLLVARWDVVSRLQLHAQALTYDTLLALVPLLAVVFAIVTGFGFVDVSGRLESLLLDNLTGSPEIQEAVREHVLGYVSKIDAGSLGAVSIIILIFSVLSLLGHIETAINAVFGTDVSRLLLQRLLTYWTVLTLGTLLLLASLAITAAFQTSAVATSLDTLGIGSVLLRGVPLLATWIAFATLYMMVPNTHVRLTSALFAAVVAGSLWNGAKFGYAIYAKHALTAQNIYGSLAVVPLFILWLYVSWILVLLGAQLAFAYQNAATYAKDALGQQASPAFRERAACNIMLAIAAEFVRGSEPFDAEKLSERLGLPRRLVDTLTLELKHAGFVREVEGTGGLVPARDLDGITVGAVVEHLRSGVGVGLSMTASNEVASLEPLFAELDAQRRQIMGQTFRDLVEKRGGVDSPSHTTQESAESTRS